MIMATNTMNLTGGAATTTQLRKVLITGVSRGLGRALALELAKRGHTVIGCSCSAEKISSLQSDLSAVSKNKPNSDQHLTMNVDVRSNSSVEELAHALLEKKAFPDIIVNNAGTMNKANRIWEIPEDEFDAVIDTNIKGTANVLRHFLPVMVENKNGIVVNISSALGRAAAAQVAPYCASKWAVEGLTKAVAKELPTGMAVVALDPGVVKFSSSISNDTNLVRIELIGDERRKTINRIPCGSPKTLDPNPRNDLGSKP